MPPFSDIFAAFRWWLVLMVLGTAVTPLTFTLFQRLPDRGYAFTKMLGLLLVSYLFWLLASLGFTGNHIGGILLALVLITATAFWLYRRQGGGLRPWLQSQWRQVLLTELLFALIFALWVWVRAQNPAITATEKPMEFAFLNAAGRSATYPPLDPWLSGYAISYYYFGYVMTSIVARLAVVPEYIAFNLGIAWLVAGTAVGAFGLVYNLVALNGRKQPAIILGLLAALALPLAGNQQITLEMAHANQIGSPAFWQWLDIRDINNAPPPAETTPRYDSSAWWWWRSSRVIHEYHLSGRAEEGLEPIAEFPGFSFVLGDMHPHVLALPFAFLSLGVALLWYLRAREAYLPESGWWGIIRPLPTQPLYWLTAIVLGGLSFLNTWDVLIHLFVIAGAFLIGRWQQQGWRPSLPGKTLALAMALAVPSILLYLPFYIGFRSQAGAPYLLPMLMQPTRLPQFLVIFGMPLVVIITLLAGLVTRQRLRHWRFGLTTAVTLFITLSVLMLLLGWIIASSIDGGGRLINLAAELGTTLPARPSTPIAPGWGFAAIIALLPAIIGARLAAPWLVLLLLAMVAAVVMVWRDTAVSPPSSNASSRTPVTLPFLLLLILTGTLLTLGPEFVYLRDNFGVRLNTIFKFYYQAWVLFGVAALVGLDLLWQMAPSGAKRAFPATATTAYAALLLLGLQFPVQAVQSRAAEYRGPATSLERAPATLNGLAYLERFDRDEYEAILWLRAANEGETAVIVEAVGGQYSQYGRIAASTGWPTLLGWAGHEYQWRGPDHPEPALRDPAVRDIYTQPNWELTTSLLDAYDVTYIYIGSLERGTYGQQAYEKFASRLQPVFQNNSVAIFRWSPGANN